MDILRLILWILLGMAAGVALAYLLYHTFFFVRENYRGVVTRGGKFRRDVGPGVHIKIPLIDGVTKVSLRQQTLSFTVENLSFGSIAFIITYRIYKGAVRKAIEELENPLDQIKATALGVAQALLAKLSYDEVVASADEIATAITRALKDGYEGFGYATQKTEALNIRANNRIQAARETDHAAAIVNGTKLADAKAAAQAAATLADAQAGNLAGARTAIAETFGAFRGLGIGDAAAVQLVLQILRNQAVTTASTSPNNTVVIDTGSPQTAGTAALSSALNGADSAAPSATRA